ncbi:MAG: threonylcarbamoyl-AMP synthase [Rhodospirillaceae bacterium]|nr:threonylcarbamoyl-AMP synthase [Rhodospirillaceae bacterium]|tara:strand:- start:1081 stop:2028 length:948 start_codon:yes stop_codon:yes gene_type:complete
MNIYKPTKKTLALAVNKLKKAKLVVFPTETVYGLGGDATSESAILKIYTLKKRPRFNPLIIHCSSQEDAMKIGKFDNLSIKLANNFWPGPLTIVLPSKKSSQVSKLATSGLQTVALRIPRNKFAIELIKLFGKPIAAPSANPSGKLSPTCAEHVQQKLGKKIDLIIDDGNALKGIESTVISIINNKVYLLRPGAITNEEIEEVLGKKLLINSFEKNLSPGMLKNHYATTKPLRINAKRVFSDEALLSFGNKTPKGAFKTLNLSKNGNLNEAAQNLFSMLHKLEKLKVRKIAVSSIPDTGLGKAINDRLKRASYSK